MNRSRCRNNLMFRNDFMTSEVISEHQIISSRSPQKLSFLKNIPTANSRSYSKPSHNSLARCLCISLNHNSIRPPRSLSHNFSRKFYLGICYTWELRKVDFRTIPPFRSTSGRQSSDTRQSKRNTFFESTGNLPRKIYRYSIISVFLRGSWLVRGL